MITAISIVVIPIVALVHPLVEAVTADLKAVTLPDLISFEAFALDANPLEQRGGTCTYQACRGVNALGATLCAGFAGLSLVIVEVPIVADDLRACGVILPDIPWFATRANEVNTAGAPKRTLLTVITSEEMPSHTLLAV